MKKKFLSFVLAICLIIPFALVLTACKDKGEPTLVTIEAYHIDSTYDFENGVSVTYGESLPFTSNDFIVILKYSDGSSQNINTGFSYKIYRIEDEKVETTELLPGNYELVFGYDGYSFSLALTILPIELDDSNVTVSGLANNYTYSPEEIYDFSGATFVYNNEITLVKDVDYTLEHTIIDFNSSTGQGEGILQCIGQGVYSGYASFRFNIVGKNIVEPTFKDTYTIAYDGQTHSDDIVDDVDLSTLTGVSSISYTFTKSDEPWSYSWITDAGTYTAIAHIEVEEGYMPIPDKTFTVVIEQIDINTLSLSSSLTDINVDFKNAEYTASDIENIITNLPQDLTYSINMLSGENVDNINASISNKTGKFEIVGTGNYTGKIEVPFAINPVDISGKIQFDGQFYTYNGSEQVLPSSIYCYVNSNIVGLTESVDYTIDYSNNTNAGTASYTITGKGNYTGEYSGTFTINKQTIDTSNYNFTWNTNSTELTYNGAKQEFATLNIPSDSNLLKLATLAYNAYSDSSCTSKAVLQNAGTYYYRAEFTLNDANNYEFDNYSSNVWFVNYGDVQIKPLKATLNYSGSESFEYTGSVIQPDAIQISVTATLKGGETTLNEGTDYTLTFNDNAIDVNVYSVEVYLNSNYYFGMNGANYEYYSSVWYTITPKQLTEDQLTINLPTITQIVWGDFELKTTSGTAKYGDIDIDLTFEVKFDGNKDLVWKLSTELNENNYSCTIADKHITGANADENVTAKIVLENRYFSKVAINGTTLADSQIQALLSTGVNIGDKVEIVCNEGYKLFYNSNESSFTFIAGTEKDVDNNYLFETTANVYIYPIDSADYIVRGIIDINRANVFNSFTVGATDMIAYNWNNMPKNTSTIYLNGGTPEISINCKEGYQASVEVVNNDDTTSTVCEKGQICNYTVTNSIKTVTIKIFRGTNTEAFLVLNFTVVDNS